MKFGSLGGIRIFAKPALVKALFDLLFSEEPEALAASIKDKM